MKKNIKFISLLLVVVLSTFSCSDFLEEEPKGILVTAEFYETEADIIKAVNGVYHNLANVDAIWMSQDIASPDTQSPDVFIGRIDNFTATTTSNYTLEWWRNGYDGISRANLLLDNISTVVMDENLKARFIKEVKFLRAYFYLNLVKRYGAVPLVTKTIDINNREEVTQGRAPLAEIWTQIESDFQAAESLPDSYDAANTGRITSGAANGFLALVYLYQEKWGLAAEKAQEVISSGEYTLLPSYRDAIWTNNSSESIFELQRISSGEAWGVHGSGVSLWSRPTCLNGGWGLNYATQDLYDAYEDNDPRREYTILSEGESYNGVIVDCLPTGSFGSLKAMGNPEYHDSQILNDANNFIFMRLSEMYLVKAEAEGEAGNIGAAEAALEFVRARARNDVNAGPNALPQITGLSQPALIDAIRHEVRVELACEGHAFYNLVRWGIAGDVTRADGKAFVDGKHELGPIPQISIDLSEGNIIQNPGY